jgi:hypothetical protein
MVTFCTILIVCGVYALASVVFPQYLPATWPPRRLKKGDPIGTYGRITGGVSFIILGMQELDAFRFRFSQPTWAWIDLGCLIVLVVAWAYDTHQIKNGKSRL